jgi:putative ABC transport system permease protein
VEKEGGKEANMLSKLKAALRALLRRTQAESELDEELRYHIERQTEQNIRLGMTPEEASRAARKAFGGVEQAKERSRDARGLRWLEELWQDLRYGARSLLRNPAFSITAISILAIGIGANTAIFSIVYAVIIRPLPYAESGRLVMIEEDWPAKGLQDIDSSLPDFLEWRNRNTVFDRLEAFSTERYDISSGSSDTYPERIAGVQVSAELFPFLGIAPVQGRGFLGEEQQIGRHRVAILSGSLWRLRFGDQTRLDGQSIKINGKIFSIVGVMPDGFHFPERETQIWVPLSLPAGDSHNTREDNWLGVIARLKQGITIGQAQAEMNLIRSRLPPGLVDGTAEFRERVVSLSEYVVGKELTTILLVLIGAVGFVLLIACANTTNLMLARAVSRRKEMAIRIALGAQRWRVIRQALTESLLIGLTGGALGLFVAIWGVSALQRLGTDLPRFADVKIDGRVLIFTIALSFVTSLLAGLAPAWQSTKTDLQKSLKDGARTASGSASGRRLRSALVVAEIALSLVLLVCTGLMINSLLRLQRIDPGFKTDHLLSMRISLPPRLYPDSRATAIVDFFKQLEERVRAIPGVELAGYTTNLPLTRFGWMRYFHLEGRPLPKAPAEKPTVDYRQISAHYFDVLGIRMLKGRAFNEGDTRNTQPVVVINESFARQYYPNEEAIGKQLSLEDSSQRLTRWTVVGVAKDIKHEGLSSKAKPELFSLLEQSLAKTDDGPEGRMFFIVRAAGDPTALATAVRREVQALDKEIPVEQVATMDRLLADSLLGQRLIAMLLFIFSLTALLLAAAGVYSVMSYSASQRTHEIGIRMALGARKIDALKLIIGQGMRLASIGIIIGLAGSLALTRFIKTLLFEVKASDPLTYASIALLIVAVSTLACYLPARRAAEVDPLAALKYE